MKKSINPAVTEILEGIRNYIRDYELQDWHTVTNEYEAGKVAGLERAIRIIEGYIDITYYR